ncbi:oligosaccharide flippase family protein [Roseomonas sp. WA12]
MNAAAPRAEPLAALVMRGAALMVVLRFVIRAIGLVSVLFTARLLTPVDFGIIGTASLVVGLFAILQSIGLGDALVRLRQVDPEHVHTAWTLNLLFSAGVTLAIWLSAPAAAGFLGEPALVEVLRWLAVTPVLNALTSPGSMTLIRDFAFGKEFVLKVFQKVAVAVAVVLAAWWTRSYWGLVWGSLIGTVLHVAGSYTLYPYRPRFSLTKTRDFFAFSFWTLVQSLATYVAITVDEVVVRRLVSTQVFGLYHVSRDLSRTMVSEMVAPAAAALLPGLARLRDEPARFAEAARQAVGAGAIVAAAAGLGVSATAPEITGLLLGPRWAGAAPFLAWTAIGVAGQTVAGLNRSILAALDRQHQAAFLWGLRAAVLTAACLAAALLGGVLAVAITYAAVSVTLTVLDYAFIFARLGRPSALAGIFLRPVLAGLAMLAGLSWLPTEGLALPVAAALKVALGATIYVAALLGLWWAMGRPRSAETALLHRLPGRLATPLLRSNTVPETP